MAAAAAAAAAPPQRRNVAEEVEAELKDPQSELAQLYRAVRAPPPGKRDGMAASAVSMNEVHQADLLELPNDGGHRYALVVVDVATRTVDCVPLKKKDAATVLRGFQTIYGREAPGTRGARLRPPKRLEIDAGNEFRGVVDGYFRRNGTFIRRGRPGRHSQQGLVESYNRILGKTIIVRQVGQELLTGETSREWVDDLPAIVEDTNRRLFRGNSEEAQRRREAASLALRFPPPATPEDRDILPIGTRVRVALDRPESAATGETLPGAFRAGDFKWSKSIHEIEDQVIKPAMQVRYLVKGIPNVAYARFQLQPVREARPPPGRAFVRGRPERRIPVAAHARRRRAGQEEVLVEWRGFPDEADWTWEKKSALPPEFAAGIRA